MSLSICSQSPINIDPFNMDSQLEQTVLFWSAFLLLLNSFTNVDFWLTWTFPFGTMNSLFMAFYCTYLVLPK